MQTTNIERFLRGVIMAEKNVYLTIYQGDSFPINVSGLPTDKDYTYYLGFQDPEGNLIGEEISYEGKKQKAFTFFVTGSYSNQFVIPDETNYADYSFAIKRCYAPEGFEETMRINNKPIGTRNIIRVYRKQVEGI